MIASYEQIRIAGDSYDTASRVDDPYSEESLCSLTQTTQTYRYSVKKAPKPGESLWAREQKAIRQADG